MHPFRWQSRRSGLGARLLGLCSLLVAAYSWGTDARTWVPLVARRASEWGRAATEEELKKTVPTLYVYDHCPFCVRARMIFGLKRMPFKLDFLMNDDVVTPTKMTGKKVLPILDMEGEAMGESLDIVAKIDAIGKPILAKAADRKDIDQWLKDNKDLMRKLTRPRDAHALYPEFATRAARATWVKNHQLSGSSFEEALDSSEEYLKQINDEFQVKRATSESSAAKSDGDAEEVANLRQEIRIQRRLSHSNIVPLIFAAETPQEVLKIEHFASGGDLHAALGCRRMISEVQAARLSEQLLCGLRYLHEEEFILHGDVKPRNIFLVPAGDAMVAQLGDFGFARECPRKAPFLCRFEGIRGSHGYMAPEILAEEAYGFGVDIFALGVIIFTLLTGYEPFYPPSNVTAPLEFDEASWEDLSKEAEGFVTGLLHQSLEERFTAAAALSHAWLTLFDDDETAETPWSPLHKDLFFHPASKVREALASILSEA